MTHKTLDDHLQSSSTYKANPFFDILNEKYHLPRDGHTPVSFDHLQRIIDSSDHAPLIKDLLYNDSFRYFLADQTTATFSKERAQSVLDILDSNPAFIKEIDSEFKHSTKK